MPPSTTSNSRIEGGLASRLEARWYRPAGPVVWLLAPLEGGFRLLAWLRRLAYGAGWLRQRRLPVPVIVVGNLSVGGTGKTPLVAALTSRLAAAGYRPGVITRGYGGGAASWPQRVAPDSDPAEVGDEPVLLAQGSAAPVVAGPDRVRDAQWLLAEGVDVIVSDDGLQHYRLARDVEIAVLDGERRLGNGHCLPAGPLREPPARLDSVDFVVVNGDAGTGEFGLSLEAGDALSLHERERTQPLSGWAGQSVHAVAGIGNPERFFAMLRRAGIDVIAHPFPDHHAYAPDELAFGDTRPVLMTAKDAVKCRAFAQPHWWSVPVEARLDTAFETALLQRIADKG